MSRELIIAIPSYKRPGSLGTLLSQLAVEEGATPFSVYVLNDGGDAESAAVLQNFSSSRFLLHTRATAVPSGLPRARNIMLDWISVARDTGAETLVCFLDDDCEVDTKFVHEVFSAAEQYNAFCFRIETVGQSGIVNTQHNSLLRKLFTPFLGRIILPLGFIRGGYFEVTSAPRRVDHLPGGCLIYRFDQYPTLRFDEALNDGHAVLEDTDFSLSLAHAGAELWYIGSYGIIHRPGSVGGVRLSVPKEKYYFYWKHKWYVIKKWGSVRIFALPLGVLECLLLSMLTRTSLLGAFISSWFTKAAAPEADLRIAAPMSGINPFSTLGGEVYDAAVLKEIAREVDVEVMLPRHKPFGDGGAKWRVRTMPALESSFLYYFNIYRALGKSYRARPFSVVRVHSPYLTAIPVLLFVFLHKRVKTFASYLHTENGFLSRIISRFAVKRWDALGVISEASKRDLISLYGADPAKIVVTYPGVDDAYSVPVSDERLRNFKVAHDLTNRFVVLHLGSLIARKNVSFLIEVIATLPERALLLVVGSGPERSALEQQAARSGCSDRVRFVGKVSEEDKMMWMHAADVFALASHKEGFGMAVAQAAASGTPGIVADTYSLPEVVRDGETGAVRPLDVDKWRTVLLMWMDNPTLIERMGIQARVRAHVSFNWENAAKMQVDFMKALI